MGLIRSYSYKYHDQCLGNNRAIKWRKSSGRLRVFQISISTWYFIELLISFIYNFSINEKPRLLRFYTDNIHGTLEQSRMKLFSPAPIRCSYHPRQWLFFFKHHTIVSSRSAVNRTESGRMTVNLHLLKNIRNIETF